MVLYHCGVVGNVHLFGVQCNHCRVGGGILELRDTVYHRHYGSNADYASPSIKRYCECRRQGDQKNLEEQDSPVWNLDVGSLQVHCVVHCVPADGWCNFQCICRVGQESRPDL